MLNYMDGDCLLPISHSLQSVVPHHHTDTFTGMCSEQLQSRSDLDGLNVTSESALLIICHLLPVQLPADEYSLTLCTTKGGGLVTLHETGVLNSVVPLP